MVESLWITLAHAMALALSKLTNLQPTRLFKCPWLPPPGKVDVFAEGQTSGSLQLRLQSVTLERCRWNIRIANANHQTCCTCKGGMQTPNTSFMMKGMVRKFFAALPKMIQLTNRCQFVGPSLKQRPAMALQSLAATEDHESDQHSQEDAVAPSPAAVFDCLAFG